MHPSTSCRLPETHLAEIFGFPADVRDADVETFRSKCLCPFRPLRADAKRDLSLPEAQVPFEEQFARCTKNSVTQPLGVCSVYAGHKPAITCPVRFAEAGVMLEAATTWASAVLRTPVERLMAVPEVRLVPSTSASPDSADVESALVGTEAASLTQETRETSAGSIDYVLADVYTDQTGSSLGADYRLLSYAALEVQAVYISGNVSKPFLEYMGGPPWDGSHPPRPDWLSSSRKRLIPQLAWKGSVLHGWGKPILVCVQAAFWETMPYLSAITGEAKTFQEMAWIIVDLARDGRVYRLVHIGTRSSEFGAALTAATQAPAGSGKLVEQAILGKAIVQLTGKKPRKLKSGKQR